MFARRIATREVDRVMQHSGDWLDRTMAFLGGFFGTFIGLTVAWALTETLTPVRLYLGGSRGAVVGVQVAISLAVAIWQGRRAGRRSASPKIDLGAIAARNRAMGTSTKVGASVPTTRNQAAGTSPKAGVRAPTAEERAMAEAMIAGVTEQVRREAELRDGTWPVPLSVRLAPQIPIRDQQAPRSWFGGQPRMPATTPWPEIEGTPCDFIAQIALEDLPAELWHGLGPRTGWLMLFMHPTSYQGRLLRIAELGPPRDAPNQPAEKDGWYNPYGNRFNDACQQRYMLRAFPQWPVDIIVIPAGETGEEAGTKNDLTTAHYRNGFDIVDPAYHPFDWPGMLALSDSALAVLESRYGKEIPSPNMLEQQLAGLKARLAAGAPAAEVGKRPTPYTSEQLAEMQHRAAGLGELIPASAEARRLGVSALAAVRQIAAEVHEQAKQLPFTPQRAEALLARLQAIQWMHIARLRDPQGRPGAERIETRVFPITVHHPDATLFAWYYHVLHFDMARHAYCRDIASVPAATRTLYEPLWRDLGMKGVPQLGGFPRAYVHAFSPDIHVMVLEVPSNQLMGWMFGDVDKLVLTMSRDEMTAGHFAEAQYDVSN
jgi:hypothetical protein